MAWGDAIAAEASAEARKSSEAGVALPRCPEWKREDQASFPCTDGHWQGEPSSFSQGQSLERDAAVSLGSQCPGTGRGKELLGPEGGLGWCTTIPPKASNPWKRETALEVWPCATRTVGVCELLTLPVRMALGCVTSWGSILKPPLQR